MDSIVFLIDLWLIIKYFTLLLKVLSACRWFYPGLPNMTIEAIMIATLINCDRLLSFLLEFVRLHVTPNPNGGMQSAHN